MLLHHLSFLTFTFCSLNDVFVFLEDCFPWQRPITRQQDWRSSSKTTLRWKRAWSRAFEGHTRRSDNSYKTVEMLPAGLINMTADCKETVYMHAFHLSACMSDCVMISQICRLAVMLICSQRSRTGCRERAAVPHLPLQSVALYLA